MSDTLNPMQEQLLSQASGILQSVTDAVGKATDFAATQLPDIAIQYVAYGRATATTFLALGVMFLILTCWLIFRVGIKNVYKIGDDSRAFLSIFGGGISSFLAIVLIVANISNFFLVWLAPKVWLIKEIVHLVK